MEKIKIKPAKAHEQQIENEEVLKEIEDVQLYFDQNNLPLKDHSINYVVLRGLYEPIDKTMMLVGVFVNNSHSTITALQGSMQISLRENSEVTFPKMDFKFPPEFLGELHHNEGFIVHVKVPTQGLESEKRVYQTTELLGKIEDIQIIKVDNN
ncbi:hypothetical protein [Alkalihalobacillus trypoxylicola]|uniref:SLAP domain-containing protein n=1 Tax=Alkalihalobacillus trypoxylicola TaxID=519424 RepID=A0A161QCZ1_9BACI|nr:hypothetical protein [Alkalihalobacillus trypoxylicola]KYG26015.1 hypothetical protein AZF04_13085 [Alkalihalobacillus trypoxylicola]